MNKIKEKQNYTVKELITMQITYTKVGDYQLPHIIPNGKIEKTYGKWGVLRREFLKNHREGQYNLLMMKNELIPHLNELDEQAREMHERIMCQLQQNNPPPPQGTMQWVQHHNSLRAIADEQVLNDLIYN